MYLPCFTFPRENRRKKDNITARNARKSYWNKNTLTIGDKNHQICDITLIYFVPTWSVVSARDWWVVGSNNSGVIVFAEKRVCYVGHLTLKLFSVDSIVETTNGVSRSILVEVYFFELFHQNELPTEDLNHITCFRTQKNQARFAHAS